MDDLISRQAAIDEIARFIGYLDEDMITRLQIALERLPSVEPERKNGKWMQDWLAEKLDIYLCSECGQPLQLRDEYGNKAKVNFCPNCGADMRGEQDDE